MSKKNEKKRIVQDYQYLNSWTIKKNYILPLISDLIDNIEKKKVFIKMNLRWGYNNVRIKEGDEWKIVFIFSTPESVYELTVIFFRLTNSPATFQTIINDLLKNLIEIGDVAAFIDDVIVGMEIKEEHNDIVEEVLRRIAENDLFVKSEKYVLKIRDIGFLGVVIGLDGVKMEKKKFQEVVDWLVLRKVKNMQKFLGLANYYKQFVKDFTRIAEHLHEIMRKDEK